MIVLDLLLRLAFWAFLARLIIDLVRTLMPSSRPPAVLLAFFSVIYAITDKPLAFFRRFIPPLRIGVAAIDLSYIVIFTLISLARSAVHFF